VNRNALPSLDAWGAPERKEVFPSDVKTPELTEYPAIISKRKGRKDNEIFEYF
jgi:hypothetical protein